MSIKNFIKDYRNLPYKNKTSINNKVSMATNFAWAVMKLILAYFISSYFLSISGFYTICIALAKCSYFDGRRNAKSQLKEEKYFVQIACMLIVAGLIYLLYIVQIFLDSHTQSYGIIIAITIATVAFCEIFFSIRGLIKTKNSKDLLLVGLKLINVCSALSSLVLTQIALLALPDNTQSYILSNTLIGIIAGLITFTIGIYMFVYLHKFNKKHYFLLKKRKFYYKNNKKTTFPTLKLTGAKK